MNYLEFFGLQSEPFLNSPSARVFYKSAAHGKALLRLMTAADADAGTLILAGPSGVGKSLLLRRVLETISDEQTRTAYATIPVGGLNEAELAKVLSVQIRGDAATSFSALRKVVADVRKKNQNVLLLVDDAQRLDSALLERLTGITGASTILVGTFGADYPDGDLFELQPLNAEATEAYIRLRLKTSGRVSEIFSQKARAKVFELSAGIPFVINSICELSLITAALAGLERIDEDIVEVSAALSSRSSAPEAVAGVPVIGAAFAATAAVASRDAENNSTAIDDDFAPAASEDNDSALDDLLGELEKEESQIEVAAADTEFGDMLGDLASGKEPVAESPAAADIDDGGLGNLLDEMEQEEETQSTFAPEDDNGLDDILGGLEAEEQAPSAANSTQESAFDDEPSSAMSDEGDNLDSLLDDLGREDPVAAVNADADDDLDSLLGGLGEDDEPAPSKATASPVADDLDDLLGDLGEADAPQASEAASDDDFDSLLNGLAEDEAEPAKAVAMPEMVQADDDGLDDLLSGLDDEPEVKVGASSDDDLDDLLSGLSDDEPEPVPTPAPVKKAATQTTAANVAVADDGDLDDLLNSLGDDPAPAATSDSLEDELDSLLEGLDD